MKRQLKVAKIIIMDDWRMGNDFEGNLNAFWKEVKRMRISDQVRYEVVKDVTGLY